MRVIGIVAAVAAGLASGVSGASTAVANEKPGSWSAPFVVADLAERNLDPQLVPGTGGRTVAFWFDLGTTSVMRRVIGANGTLGPAQNVATRGDGHIGPRWVARGRAGAALVLWEDSTASGTVLRGRWVDPNGRLGPIREVAAPEAFDEPTVSTATDDRGNVTIAWVETRIEEVSAKSWRVKNAAIHVRRWTAGDRLGPRFTVERGDELALAPRLAAASSGQMALAWWQGREDRGDFVVKVAPLTRAGSIGAARTVSSPVRKSFAFGVEDKLGLALDERGTATVLWDAPSGSGRQLLLRQSTRGGRLGAQRVVGRVTVAVQSTLVADRAGRVTVVWTPGQASGLTAPSAVRARRIDAVGRIHATRLLSRTGSIASGPVVAADRSGRVTVAWVARTGGPGKVRSRLQTRALGVAGRPGPLRSLPPKPGHLSYWSIDLVVGDGGSATAAWTRHSQAATIVMAARLPRVPGH